MSRRKSEIAGYMNERNFPHLVELELPSGGFRNKNQEFESFHRARGITIRRGCGRHEGELFQRVVIGKIMTPADLRRLHKYMLDIEKVSAISDEMRAIVESEWPELAHKLPPRR